MKLAQRLYTLQSVELELAQKSRRWREIQAALGDTAELDEAQAALDAAEAQVDRLRRQQREREQAIQSLRADIEAGEAQLMSGRIRNPRELESMQQNVESMRRRLAHLEDQLLETMIDLDEALAVRQTKREQLDVVRAGWEATRSDLLQERATLEKELRELQARHRALLGELPADVMAEFRRLQERRGGYAVSQVVGGVCQVCGVVLPVSLVHEARDATSELVYCGSCGRILYAPD
ncbi:MAG: C4-type zinc ribbon domain-containing protein [Anaerolineae bacterium]